MKNCIMNNVLFFTAGAVIGSLVTWKIINEKCEKRINEEVESIRELYEKDQAEDAEDEDNEYEELDDEEKYEQIISESKYRQYQPEKEKEEEVDDNMIDPYVIIPEEFDENGYETMTLFYFADGVLAYGDTNEAVENVGELVCEDFAEHFGEYEDDSVFVRNDNLRIDFEILKDNRNYSEVN